MNLRKVSIVLGTRPEVIKLWPVIKEFRESGIEICVISTNQQKKLVRETFASLGFLPDINLDIPNKNGNLNDFLSRCIAECEKVLLGFQPELVIVQGDTVSALGGAIASHNLRIRVAHVEAGLRSGDMENPWPEEGYRRLIDSISSILWVPTKQASVQLQPDQEMYVVGNTSIDALRLALETNPPLSLKEKKVIVTLHRRESFGLPLENTLKNIISLSQCIENEIIFIQHPNPNVQVAMDRVHFQNSSVRIIEPVPYIDFIGLISSSALIISDSGGLQEESTALKIPLLIARDKTERSEAVSLGGCVLVGSNGQSIVEESKNFLGQVTDQKKHGIQNTIFGDGFAARKILDTLKDFNLEKLTPTIRSRK